MNIYTFYSPSHKEMFEEFFLKSYNEFLSLDFKLTVQTNDQKTANGNFFDPNWNSSMDDKLSLLKNAIKENEGKWFIYSDCDIQFFENIKNDIEFHIKNSFDLDMLAQEDVGTICAGFLIIKGSQKMLNFIELVELHHKKANDQIVMNALKSSINYKLLPKEKYFTIGNFNGGGIWEPSHGIKLPNKLLVHHANFTVGVENKIKMLIEVKKLNKDLQ